MVPIMAALLRSDLSFKPAATAAAPLPGFNTGTATQPASLGAYVIGANLPQYGPHPERK